KRSWLWAITPDTIAGYALPPRDEIETSARKIYDLLTARQLKKDPNEDERLKRIAEADSKLQTEAAALSRMLLGPISARLQGEWKNKRLAVVASGALEYAPFAVLPAPETEGQGDGATGRQGDRGNTSRPVALSPRLPVPLIADHEIVYLPSASALSLI